MISPYIKKIKNWKIREMVVTFLEAKATFESHNKTSDSGDYISFGMLRKICDMLYEIKEDHHLIYKEIINPKKRTFEQANKLTPNEGDINFINDAGLLFHKVMISRELKYMLDYYKEDSAGYQETKASLERNLERIEILFKIGITILKTMLKSHKNNIYLITYFLENQEFCSNQFETDLESLMKILTEKDSLEKVYLTAAKYYITSGWVDKAGLMCQKSLTLNPQNTEAKNLLKSF